MLFGQQHVQRYIETDGEVGHQWQGTTVLILTTVGRRTGKRRSTPLIYGRHGEDYLVVASKGGADTPPGWYLNLVANPEVTLQVGADRFTARARAAGANEKAEVWQAMVAQWPSYDDYQQKTVREIPVVVLEPR